MLVPYLHLSISSSICVLYIGVLFFFCSGKVIVHALDEKAREYYNLEGLWTTDKSQNDTAQVL